MYVLHPGMYVTSVESESESVELRTTYRRNYRSNYRLNYGRGTLDRTTLRDKDLVLRVIYTLLSFFFSLKGKVFQTAISQCVDIGRLKGIYSVLV